MSYQRLPTLVIGLAVTILSGSQSWSQTPAERKNEGSNTTPKATEQPLSEYWTEERLRNAKPKETPSISPQEHEAIQKKKGREKRNLQEDRELPQRDLKAFGTPSDADVSIAPYIHAGKMYFTLAGSNYSCSAQFLGDLTVVHTAAHCVRDASTGAWATNVVFFRGFKDGTNLQVVGTVCLSTKAGWVTGGAGRYKWDYAFIKTAAPSSSGYFGLKTLIPYGAWEAIGYPSNFASARIMQKFDGTKGTVTADVVQMNGNPMRSGNSGGAWDVGGYVVGNNSYHVTGDTTSEWSPYYDSEVINLWRYALNGCK